MNYKTYILESLTSGKLYIGQTADLDSRILRYNRGGSRYTKGKGPWELLCSVGFSTRSEAVFLEKRLKAYKNLFKVKSWIESQMSDKQ